MLEKRRTLLFKQLLDEWERNDKIFLTAQVIKQDNSCIVTVTFTPRGKAYIRKVIRFVRKEKLKLRLIRQLSNK